jgi:hypothetical protein
MQLLTVKRGGTYNFHSALNHQYIWNSKKLSEVKTNMNWSGFQNVGIFEMETGDVEKIVYGSEKCGIRM